MVRLGIFATFLTIAAAIGVAQVTPTSALAAGECVRKEFKTKMVKEACAKGGQKAAKDAMKAFLKVAKTKNAKITGCPTCHKKVGGDFPLTDNALTLFKDAGGEMLDAKPAPATSK